ERFDPECVYIKKWVPELADLTNRAIHTLFRDPHLKSYSAPIVDHNEAKEIAEDIYLDAKSSK
ncbi:deoxyribodipyrimidine photo-lyase, partial [Candidatus Saccharibacteria bacterium]|nr:deoxyribodipyrimidine photo-lyase [Candidatus Saccharibacteria bacterium]